MLAMDKIALIGHTVRAIMAMDSDTRIGIANRLLRSLEEKKEVTRWQFWDRYSVKEHGEEMAERALTEAEVDTIMDELSSEWNSTQTSLNETDAFTEVVKNSINHS
jgi:hypothetical protein